MAHILYQKIWSYRVKNRIICVRLPFVLGKILRLLAGKLVCGKKD